jgi:hypothetical protein
MDQLARDFAGKAVFLFVYTRVAHPEDFPDYPAHQSFNQKWRHAEALQQQQQRTPRRILVDNLEGSVHRLYGGRLNTCWVINDKGQVSYKSEWASEPHLRKALEETLCIGEFGKPRGYKDFYQESMTLIEGGRPPAVT